MKPFTVSLLAAAMALPLPAQPANKPEPFPPAAFSTLYIERDEKGVATVIQLNGDAVIYTVTDKGKELEKLNVHPGGDDWFNFIQKLNAAKVYTWAPSYQYPGIGVSWVIEFTMPERKFSSQGQNEFPKNGDEANPQADPKAGPSIPFQLFWQAVLELVGKTQSK